MTILQCMVILRYKSYSVSGIMEAQLYEIASHAGRALFSPVLLAGPLIGILALATGAVDRLTIVVEDLQAGRAPNPAEPVAREN